MFPQGLAAKGCRAFAKYDWQRFNKESPARAPVPSEAFHELGDLLISGIKPSSRALGHTVAYFHKGEQGQ